MEREEKPERSPDGGQSPDPERSVVLLGRARGGDKAAQDELVRRIQPKLLALVRRRMGPHLRARDESVDLAQSVLLEAVRGIEHFEPDGDGALLRWLSRILENRLRRKARDMRIGERDPGRVRDIRPGSESTPGYEPTGKEATPSIILSKREERERIRELVARLPERERKLVQLRRFDGLEWSEVLERAGEKDLHAARNAYSRGLAKLVSWWRDH